MGRYTVIPQDTFEALQMDAGVLLSNFNIEAAASDPDTAGFTPADVITPTTGGVTVNCKPTFSDFGSDVDNCPNNMMELKHLDSWDCSIQTTALGTSKDLIKLQLGCVDMNSVTKAIIPRADLKQSDFKNLWWVGDKANGGFIACQILNGLSTDGLSLKSGKNAKGQTNLNIVGHVSLNNQKLVPMIFYSIDPDDDILDASLNALTIGTNALTPSFNGAVTEYTLNTENATDVITAASTDADATIVIKNGTTTVANGSAATWTAGENTVKITVTNGSGASEVEKVYTITVNYDNE